MSEGLRFGPPAISVDVEDWPQSTWDRSLPITKRSAANTQALLRILSDARVHATLFVLGKFAETFPDVVREIKSEGHEVASHGYGHVEVFKQSPQEFAADARRSKELLESITGMPVIGYRAPDFSITRTSLWALDILAELGFRYDSSIFPIHHPRYGFPEWPASPVSVNVNGGHILELPISTCRFAGRNWPAAGGGYTRLLPGLASRYLARRVMRSTPFVYYCHPYEFDPAEFSQIAIKVPLRVRLHQGFGRRWSKPRFNAFLSEFRGQTIQELIASKTWPAFDARQELRQTA